MNGDIYTAIDACINRAIEGLRVCEDIFRFALHNHVSSEFKLLRHSIRDAVSGLPVDKLLDSRDINSDSQKFIDADGERHRPGLAAVFRSNIRRAAEAVRSLEELFKIDDPGAGARFQSIRFRIYEVEKNCWFILKKSDLVQRINDRLCAVIGTSSGADENMIAAASEAADKGAGIILLKLPPGSDSANLSLAKKISSFCIERDIIYFIYSRPDMAVLSGAAGICLEVDDLSVEDAAKITGSKMLLGITAVDESGTFDAAGTGADFVIFNRGSSLVMIKCPASSGDRGPGKTGIVDTMI